MPHTLCHAAYFVPCSILCHIGVADDSALYQWTRPNVPGYLNLLLAPCCITINLPSKMLLHYLLLNFYTHARARTHIANSLRVWASEHIAFDGRIEPKAAIYYTHI
jgi:hypothetical protein